MFHYLLAGASAELHATLQLTDDSYAYIAEPCRQDGASQAAWSSLLAAFRSVGFSEAAIDNIIVTLSAILQLGNVRFDALEKDGTAVPADMAALERAARTLMVRPQALAEAFTVQHLQVGQLFACHLE